MRLFAQGARLGLMAVVIAMACLFAPAIATAVEGDNEATSNAAPSEALPTDGQKMVSSSNTAAAQQEKDKQTLQENGGPGPIDLGDGNYVNPMQLPDSSFIYDITIADLAKADSYLNGQTVQVVGEVVGDSINAEIDSDFCWTVLADSAGNTVSVYMPIKDKALIDTYGRYGQTGTQLQARGVFSLSCDQHQGQTDIHSAHINLVRKGEVHRDSFEFENFIPGVVAVAIGLIMLFIYWRLRERLR